jgi:hypothetical protein
MEGQGGGEAQGVAAPPPKKKLIIVKIRKDAVVRNLRVV